MIKYVVESFSSTCEFVGEKDDPVWTLAADKAKDRVVALQADVNYQKNFKVEHITVSAYGNSDGTFGGETLVVCYSYDDGIV